jgi:transcriptional regulator with XRE-family HTH domain
MGRTTFEQAIADRQRHQRRAIGDEIRAPREDAGLSIRAVARASGIDPSHLSRVEAGDRSASQDALVAIAGAIGCTVSTKLFPSDGPRLRDHLQALMVNAVVGAAHPRWRSRVEVAVHRPVRGVIDLVLEDLEHPDLVAGEAHSQLRSAESQLRRAGEKADGLPAPAAWSWPAHGASGGVRERDAPRTSRLLVLRSCHAMHDLVRTLPHLFRAAYPAHPSAAFAALTTSGPRWPGSAILWVTVDGAATRVIDGLPRSLRGAW